MAPQAPFGFEIWWRKPTTSSIRPHAHTVGAGGAAGAPLFGTEGCQGPAHCLNLHPSANFRTCIAVFCTRPLTLGLKIFILPIGGAQSATFWHKVGLSWPHFKQLATPKPSKPMGSCFWRGRRFAFLQPTAGCQPNRKVTSKLQHARSKQCTLLVVHEQHNSAACNSTA